MVQFVTTPGGPVTLTCFICFEDLEPGDRMVGLNCGHGANLEARSYSAHVQCMADTFTVQENNNNQDVNNNNEPLKCPVCRTVVPQGEVADIYDDIAQFLDNGGDLHELMPPEPDPVQQRQPMRPPRKTSGKKSTSTTATSAPPPYRWAKPGRCAHHRGLHVVASRPARPRS